MPNRLPQPALSSQLLYVLIAGWLAATAAGCAGHSAKTADARSALDQGAPQQALASLNQQLGVESGEQLPSEIKPDQQLFVLDRATVQQALGQYELSSRDLETADKGIELLDFAHTTGDDLGKYLFSDDTGPYQAPPYEKLMINTINMMNYLARGDLSGGRVEARRFAVMQKFIAESEDNDQAFLAPGSYLAGFIFEKSRKTEEALLYYDDAVRGSEAFTRYKIFQDPICRLAAESPKRSPTIEATLSAAGDHAGPLGDDADLLVIVNYGRVPAKKAERVPVGLALTMAADFISPDDVTTANRLAAQGLVTWVNFPTLGEPTGEWSTPTFIVDGRPQKLDGMLAVDQAARRAWASVQGIVVASAITRMITRIVAGEVTRQVAGKGVLGSLLSLGTQVTMTAVDTPDTRSWSTLPARIAFGRVRLKAGTHQVQLAASGAHKAQQIDLKPGGWGVVMLTVLR